MAPTLVELSRLKNLIYNEVLRAGKVSGIVSWEPIRTDSSDGTYVINRIYNFLDFKAITADCSYKNKSEAETEALDDCLADLRGRRGLPLWPNTLEPEEISSDRRSQKITVKKYVLG